MKAGWLQMDSHEGKNAQQSLLLQWKGMRVWGQAQRREGARCRGVW